MENTAINGKLYLLQHDQLPCNFVHIGEFHAPHPHSHIHILCNPFMQAMQILQVTSNPYPPNLWYSNETNIPNIFHLEKSLKAKIYPSGGRCIYIDVPSDEVPPSRLRYKHVSLIKTVSSTYLMLFILRLAINTPCNSSISKIISLCNKSEVR